MENKTYKPYSLRDAKDEVAVTKGFKDWLELWSKTKYEITIAALEEAAELYKEKATEELRKANEELQTQVSMFQTDRSERIEEMKRLKESNKQLEQNRLADDIQMHDLYAKIRTLEESNKELVEALKLIYKKSRYDENHDNILYNYKDIHELSYELIQKSEGDVNKKI